MSGAASPASPVGSGSFAQHAAETDLAKMLASLQVDVREGEFVFVSAAQPESLPRERAQASVVEAEGLTCVLRREDADAHGLSYEFVAAWLSLRVHSALHAVGLTAAIARALSERGIACNVLAGFHHDHLLVPLDRRDEAVAALQGLRNGENHPSREKPAARNE